MKTIAHTASELLDELEVDYPPRCMDPQERPEDHHRYAGKVELIQDLRRRFEWTHDRNKT